MSVRCLLLTIFFNLFLTVTSIEFCIGDYCVWKRNTPRKNTLLDLIIEILDIVFQNTRSLCSEVFLERTNMVVYVVGSVTIMVLFFLLIKGRHRTLENQTKHTTSQSTSSAQCTAPMATAVKVSNTVRFESDAPASIRNHNRAAMKQPSEFNETTDVAAWFAIMQTYLEKCCETKEWFDVAVSYIHMACLKDMPSIKNMRDEPDNFHQLKTLLNKKYGTKSFNQKFNIVDFANLKQAPNQSIREYGDTVHRTAQIVFSTMSPNMIESHVVSAFSKGLVDDELRAYAKKKILQAENKKEYLSFEQLLDHVQIKEATRISAQILAQTKHSPIMTTRESNQTTPSHDTNLGDKIRDTTIIGRLSKTMHSNLTRIKGHNNPNTQTRIIKAKITQIKTRAELNTFRFNSKINNKSTRTKSRAEHNINNKIATVYQAKTTRHNGQILRQTPTIHKHPITKIGTEHMHNRKHKHLEQVMNQVRANRLHQKFFKLVPSRNCPKI